MPAVKPQTRFLLRGSALLISLLIVWWFFLVNPLLFFLRGALEVSGSLFYGSAAARELVTETPSGDWSFRVPMEIVLPPSPEHPNGAQGHSIDFDMPRSDVIAFTFSLPVFWGIVLAAPGIRRALWPLIQGTVLVTLLEIVLVVSFVEISAHKVAAQFYPPQGQAASWLLRFGEYMVVNVIPYAAPFLIAITLHRELRWQMFRWGMAEGAPPPKPGAARGNQARHP